MVGDCQELDVVVGANVGTDRLGEAMVGEVGEEVKDARHARYFVEGGRALSLRAGDAHAVSSDATGWERRARRSLTAATIRVASATYSG